MEAVVELPSAQRHPLLPLVLGSAAIRRMHRGEMSTAARYAERGLASCDGVDDLRRALPTEALASICLMSGRLEEAFDHYGEAALPATSSTASPARDLAPGRADGR